MKKEVDESYNDYYDVKLGIIELLTELEPRKAEK